jgi:hypothetical protein
LLKKERVKLLLFAVKPYLLTPSSKVAGADAGANVVEPVRC